MSLDDINDTLLGGGIPSAKFENIGDTVVGTLVDGQETQRTDFTTGAPKFWDDGKPMMQSVLTLQTEQRDPALADDDGKRKLYVKGSKKDPQSLAGAVINAVRASGGKLEVGGRLAVQYTGDGTASRAGMNAPKQYVAQYEPPAIGAGLLDTPAAPATPATNLLAPPVLNVPTDGADPFAAATNAATEPF